MIKFINPLAQLFQPKDAEITLSLSFDNKYLEYGKIILNSIRKNSPTVKVIALVINVSQQDLQEFLDWENLNIIFETKQFSHPYEQRLYSTTRRIFFINQLRQNHSIQNLLQLDADLIVRKDLNRFRTLFEQGDLCILAKLHMKHEPLRLIMNVLGLANTPAAKALTQEWIAQLWQILQEPQDSKYIDQLTLWKAYEKVHQELGIKLVNLAPPFIGKEHNAIIRTFYATKDAKGDTKLLKELNQFTNQSLKEAPSHAPQKPEDTSIFLTRELLKEHFQAAGYL